MTRFEETRGRGETLSLIRDLSMECAVLGGPLSQQLNALIQSGSYRAVVEFKLDGSAMDKAQQTDYLYARQIKALVEKQDFLDLGYDREKEAVSKFIAAEEKCFVTNTRFWNDRPKWDVAGVLYTAQRIIGRILGPVPRYEEMSFLFGPGASTNVVGRIASFRTKLAAPMQCSKSLESSLGDFLAEFPLWCDAVAVKHSDESWTVPVEVRPARLGFVPKTSKTDRTICVEPSLNALGQKGIGSYMKKRLGLFGVDLLDQSVNQSLALKGSIDGSLATVDLSSASDTVSYALVMSLLPTDWFNLLDRFRSESVEFKGVVTELEKFSSMGNAYTFELESLIFYSLALSVCDYLNLIGESIFDGAELLIRDWPISVYGDDIIIPVDAVQLLYETLNWCGFEVNTEKSFSTGGFRESCGADWLFGFDVRPWYLRKEISERSLFVAHNFFLRRGERSLAKIVLSYTRKEFRLFGPDGYGDGHLLGDYSLRPAKAGFDGGYFRSWKGVSCRYDKSHQTDVLIPSYSVYARMGKDTSTDPYVVRGTKRYKTTSIYTTRRGIFRPW
jgi:hypothetical protein